VDQLN